MSSESKQRHEFWPFGWVTAIWFQALLLVVLVGLPVVGTLASPHPLSAVGALLFMAGAAWGLMMRRKHGWIKMLAMPEAVVPTQLCWAAISPSFFLIYAVSGNDLYIHLALGGLFFSVPSALMLVALSRPKVRERLRTNIAKEAAERAGK